jgi:hypothetical protein
MYIRKSKPVTLINKPKEEDLNSECIIIIVDPDRPAEEAGSIAIPPATTANTKPQPKPKLDPLPSAVINEKTMTFRMDSRTLWTKYALGLVNFAVSDVADLSTTSSVEQRMYKSSTLLGDFFTPYYGIRAGSDIGNLLTEIFKNGVQLVEAVKKQQDIVPYQVKWADQTKALAELFNKLNPGQYPVSLLQEMFDALTKLWTDNIVARYTKNIILNAESIDGINQLVITGIANHINKGYTSIADVLSRGVIAQYPLSFVE